MTLLEQVKEAIRKGFTDEQVALTLQVSIILVRRARSIMDREEKP